MADSVKIRIDGDDSGFRKELQQSEKSAASAAAAMAAEFRKSGMQQSEAFRRAWEEIKSAQSRGATVVINNVETIIRANKDLERSTKSISTKGYDALAASADDMRRDVTNDLAAIRTQTERMSDGFYRAGNVLKTAFTGIAVVAAVRSVAQTFYEAAKAGVTYNADIEQLKTSFEVMTGSAKEAAAVVERLRKLGASTPYDFAGLATTTQTLMQYNLTADEAIRVTEMIGDIAQGSADKMSRISMAYGQMASSGKVSLEDVKQMIEAGFNPLLVISEKTGESMESLYKRISEGTLTVEELTDAMVTATSEGGMFFESMEKQSQTLNGQLSTLKDNLQTFGGTVFAGISESLTTTVLPAANAMIEELNAAYERNGVDGLLRVIERKIPQLVSKATEIAKTVFAQVGKRIPSMVNGIFQNLPATLESFFEILTTLSDTLFDTLSVIVTNLVERFPEYAPVILRGIVNLAMSIVKGSIGVIQSAWRSIFGGPAEYELARAVDRMFHNVDQDRVLSISAEITSAVDNQNALTEINTKFGEIRDALMGFDIDPSVITQLLGEDYETIYNTLLSFGLDEIQATELATQVSDVNTMVQTQLNTLGVRISNRELFRLFDEAAGNRRALLEVLQSMGFTPTQIEGIIGLYNSYAGDLSEGIVSLADTIATALTDGEADTEAVVNGLVEQANAYYDGVFAQIDAWEAARLAEIDPEAPDYATAVANIKQQAEDMRTAIEESQTATLLFISQCAGKSTEEVRARMSELDEIEARVQEVTDQMDAASAQMHTLEQAAYNAVIAGADTDERTVGLAIDFVADNFKFNQHSIDTAYEEAVNQALYDLNAGTITTEQYNAIVYELGVQYEIDSAANRAEYENALISLFQGVADAMPDDVAAPLIEAAQDLDVANQINDIIASAAAGEEIDFSAISNSIRQAYDDAFGPGAFDWAMSNGNTQIILDGLADVADGLIISAAEVFESTDAGMLGAAMSAVIDNGLADGTSFAGLDTPEFLAAVFGNAIDRGVETIQAGQTMISAVAKDFSDGITFEIKDEDNAEAVEQVQSLVDAMAEAVTEGKADIDAAAETATSDVATVADIAAQMERVGRDAIQGMINSILNGRSGLEAAAKSVANVVPNTIAKTLDIRSPSRVTMKLGEYTGQGYEIGVVESLRQAVSRAENIVGSMNLSTKLTAPALTGAFGAAAQDIADAEASRPVVLSIDGKELGMVMTPYTRTAQNSYNYSLALGVGK